MTKFKNSNVFVRYTAVTTLLTVAIIHLYFVKTQHISPWKAGGFGMFSTVSSPYTRFVRVFVKDSLNRKIPLHFSHKFDQYKNALRHFPAETNFKKFRTALLKDNWVIKSGKIISSDDTDTCCRSQEVPYKIKNISVELWQYKFDIKSSALNGSLLKEF